MHAQSPEAILPSVPTTKILAIGTLNSPLKRSRNHAGSHTPESQLSGCQSNIVDHHQTSGILCSGDRFAYGLRDSVSHVAHPSILCDSLRERSSRCASLIVVRKYWTSTNRLRTNTT